jgi:DNA-binding response OmpR family regulator
MGWECPCLFLLDFRGIPIIDCSGRFPALHFGSGEPTVPGTLEGKNILIVDDDPDIVAALSALLSDTGATIQTAGDGNQAIESNNEFKPDLILLDANLPKRSGFLVLEKIKGAGKRGQKPYVIIITGNKGKRHQMFAESLGVEDYIIKPFRMDRLMKSIEGLLV